MLGVRVGVGDAPGSVRPPTNGSQARGSIRSTSSSCATGPAPSPTGPDAAGSPAPDDVVAATRARYIDVYERIAGRRWNHHVTGRQVSGRSP
jgi:hypothetical protein